MAVNIPTLSELYQAVKTDYEVELDINIPIVGKSVIRAIAAVRAAQLKVVYLFIAKVQKNIFVDTADSEALGGTLERFGRVKLGRNPLPSTAAEYECDINGTVSATIPAQTTFKSDDTSLNPGQLFILDSAETIPGSGTATITLRSLAVGTDNKLNISDTLTSTAPILNVDDQCAVSAETQTPTDGETLEQYRQNTIEAFRIEAQGGAVGDYRIWAADASGVRKVYPYAKGATNNTIEVFVEASGSNPVPTSSILNDVEDVLELDPDTTKPINERGRRPLGVLSIDVTAITEIDVDITVTGLFDNTTAIQNTIETALEDYLFNVRPFIAGAEILADKNDILTVGKLQQVIQAAIGTNNYFTSISVNVNGSPLSSSFTFDQGNIPKLNTLTFA